MPCNPTGHASGVFAASFSNALAFIPRVKSLSSCAGDERFMSRKRMSMLAKLSKEVFHEKRKLRGLSVKSVRRSCKRGNVQISQEEAARLLGIAKNTWVRWESGEFSPDILMLELLPCLVRNECPQPCFDSRAHKLDCARMAEHIRTCRDCWLAINYLAVVAKRCPHKRMKFFRVPTLL